MIYRLKYTSIMRNLHQFLFCYTSSIGIAIEFWLDVLDFTYFNIIESSAGFDQAGTSLFSIGLI